MNKCKLCNTQTKLIKRSHLYPEFLYKNFYNNIHKIEQFYFNEIENKNIRRKSPSLGYYEKDLFCENCETKVLSTYETYISRILTNTNKNILRKYLKEEKLFLIENLDYLKIKKFILSILYKFHVSNSEYFNFQLDQTIAEDIRKFILNKNSSLDKLIDDRLFQINIFKFKKDSIFNKVIVIPESHSNNIYTIIAKGYLVYISASIENPVSMDRLKNEGSIKIGIISEKFEKTIYDSLVVST
jgi:hypothetical protein